MLTKRDDVDDEDSVLERSKLEVGQLNEWPDHPVLAEGVGVGRLNLLLWVGAFHDCHVIQEGEQVARREDELIEADACKDLAIGRRRNADAALENTEPLGSEGTEDGCGDGLANTLRHICKGIIRSCDVPPP